MYFFVEKSIVFILILFFIFLLIYLLDFIFIKFGKKLLKQILSYFYNSYKKFLLNKKVLNFINRHPKIIFFLKNRIDRDNFLGLPFTILFLLILYIITEYIGLTDSILDGSILNQIDVRLSEFFYYFKDFRLIKVFLFISYFGKLKIILLFTFFVSIILFLEKKFFEIIGLLSSILLTSVIAFLSKNIIERPRPELAVYKEIGYSFPSFHAAISIAFYGFIIWLFILGVKKWKKKINIIFIGISIAFLIGLSRLYLNVHYLSDVIGGWFLGWLGLSFGITITGFLKHKFGEIHYKIKSKKLKKFIYIFLFTFTILFLAIYYKSYSKNIIFNKNINRELTKIENINEIFLTNPRLKFTETITGRSTEPINFIFIVKNKNDIEKIFKNSGWSKADKIGRTALKNMGENLLDNKIYNTAPMTPLYWNKKIQDYGFQNLPDERTIKFRHHIRIWKTNFKLNDSYIYVGCGVYDEGLKWGITHKIDPNLDEEREYIFNSFKKTNLIKATKKIQLEKGFKGTNFSGDPFFTDGKAYIIELR